MKAINLINVYFDQIFPGSSIFFSSNYNTTSQESLIVNTLKSGGKVLDVGSNSKYLKFRNYSKYFTISLFKSRECNNHLIADACTLPFTSNTFDLIICNFVLEHVHSVELVIKELSRVLNSLGKVVFLVPSMDIKENLSYLLTKRTYLPLFHFRTFGPFSIKCCFSFGRLRSIISKYKLNIVDFTGLNLEHNSGQKKIQKKFPLKYFGTQTQIICKK